MSDYSYRSEDDLRELYFEEDMTQSEMANLLDTSTATISKWMDRHGIDTGNRKWSDIPAEDVAELYDPTKSFAEMASGTDFDADQIRTAAIEAGVHNPNPLEEVVYDDEELLEQIETVHSDHGFVSKRLFESLDWTASVSAVRNHFGSWLGGVRASSVEVTEHQIQSSSAPQTNESRDYDKPRGSQSKYKSSRIQALERDGYQCAVCGKSSGVSELHTHHIDPVHTFDDPNDAHIVENLVTLCKEHHNDVHRNNIECPEPPLSD